MPRLSEVLCKNVKTGRSFTSNVKCFRRDYKNTYKHKKILMPNLLGKQVSSADNKVAADGCREEMFLLLNCMKKNEFRENSCAAEYEMFIKCTANHRAEMSQMKKFRETDKLGVAMEGGKMNSHQTNKLLTMFPEPPYKIAITHNHGHRMKTPIVFMEKKIYEDNTQRGMFPNIWPQSPKK